MPENGGKKLRSQEWWGGNNDYYSFARRAWMRSEGFAPDAFRPAASESSDSIARTGTRPDGEDQSSMGSGKTGGEQIVQRKTPAAR